MSSISAEWRSVIAQRDYYRCNYCLSQQHITGVSMTIDHIVPQSLGGAHEMDNLCLACWDCNLLKSDKISGIDIETAVAVRLFHPLKQIWEDHFQWSNDGSHIIGSTPTGRATVTLLRLNRPHLVLARQYWVKAGWHPPKAT